MPYIYIFLVDFLFFLLKESFLQMLINIKLTPQLFIAPSSGDVANKHLIKSGVITALAIEPPIYNQNSKKLGSENGTLINTWTYTPNIYLIIYNPYAITMFMLTIMFLVYCTFKHLNK